MSVYKVNDCVLLPHYPNWQQGAGQSRMWATSLAEGVTAAEDRSSGRSKPLQSAECVLLAKTQRERRELQARIQEALRTGRACIPKWGSGREMQDASGKESIALLETCGRWVPAQGDTIFVHRRPSSMVRYELRVNCGGGATGSYIADAFYTNGSTASTGTPFSGVWRIVDDALALVTVADPQLAPASVYQTRRESLSTSSARPAPIIYQFENLPDEEFLVRLHWGYFDTTTDEVRMDVSIEGNTGIPIEGFALNVQDDNHAYILEARIKPDQFGRIRITIQPVPSLITGVCRGYISGIELICRNWEVATVGADPTRDNVPLTSRLLGSYPEGSQVHPLIFGRLKVGRFEALDDYHAEASLRVEEPVGDGAWLDSACVSETCDLAFPAVALPLDVYGSLSCGVGFHEDFFDLYVHAEQGGVGYNLMLGVFEGTKPSLTNDEIQRWANLVRDGFQSSVDPSTVSTWRLVWVQQTGGGGQFWYGPWASDVSPSYQRLSMGSSSIWYRVAIQYCLKD